MKIGKNPKTERIDKANAQFKNPEFREKFKADVQEKINKKSRPI